MNLAKTQSAIGLYAYCQPRPVGSFYLRFHSLVLKQSAMLGITPTYFFGDDDRASSAKMTKFGGRKHKRILDDGFESLTGRFTSVAIAANPEGSRAPALDSFFDVHIGFMKIYDEVLFSYTVDESFLGFGTTAFENVLREWVAFYDWSFGIAFSSPTSSRPSHHIISAGHPNLSTEDRRSLQDWYSTPPEIRMVKLRSVYSYNIVNEQQLSQTLQSGLSLKQFIEHKHIGVLETLHQNNLYLWKVPDESQRQSLREQLKQQGILIS